MNVERANQGRSTRRRVIAAMLFTLGGGACADGAGPLEPGQPAEAVAEVRVSPGEIELEVGASRVATPSVRGADGKVLTGRPVSWRSSDETVASVDARGRITARRTGTTTISASSGGKRGAARLRVADPVIASIEVAPGALTLEPGAERTLSVRALDAAGRELPAAGWWDRVTWTTSDPAVAFVDAGGRVQAGRGGSATVTATVQGVSATATVTVPAELAFDLSRVDGAALPATLDSTWVRTNDGGWVRRWTRATAGSLTLSTVDAGYRQRLTVQVVEDRYWLVDGQRVPCCTVVVETREVVDDGTVSRWPMSPEFHFSSTTTEYHRFVGRREPNHGGFLARHSVQGRGDAHEFEYVER